jgi:hypothetical protein
MLPRYRQRRAGKVDATAVSGNHAAIAFRKDRRQGARFGGSQQESQEVPSAFGLGPIFKRRSVVEQRVIVHQLHVAGSKLYEKVQNRIVGEALKGVEGHHGNVPAPIAARPLWCAGSRS